MKKIISTLFSKYVGISEKELSKKLYMSIEEVSTLIKNGMYVGSHGCMHSWLDRINENEQLLEIKNSLEFLEEINDFCFEEYNELLLEEDGDIFYLTQEVFTNFKINFNSND